MAEYKKFTDLTDEELLQIITDIFNPELVADIMRYPNDDSVTCNIVSTFTDGKKNFYLTDEVDIYNPFSLQYPIDADFTTTDDDIIRLKQFCIAHGIMPDWMHDNPYMKGENDEVC